MASDGPFILNFVEDDLLPFLQVEWEGQDITGFDIKLHVKKPNGVVITKTFIVDDANVGGAGTAKFHFEWASGDLCAGESTAEIEVFDATLKNETFQGLVFQIAKDLA